MKKILLKKGIKFIIATLLFSFISNSLKKNENKIKKALKEVFSFRKKVYYGFLWSKEKIEKKSCKDKIKDISNLAFEVKIAFSKNIEEIKKNIMKNRNSDNSLSSIIAASAGFIAGESNSHSGGFGHFDNSGHSFGSDGSSGGGGGGE